MIRLIVRLLSVMVNILISSMFKLEIVLCMCIGIWFRMIVLVGLYSVNGRKKLVYI